MRIGGGVLSISTPKIALYSIAALGASYLLYKIILEFGDRVWAARVRHRPLSTTPRVQQHPSREIPYDNLIPTSRDPDQRQRVQRVIPGISPYAAQTEEQRREAAEEARVRLEVTKQAAKARMQQLEEERQDAIRATLNTLEERIIADLPERIEITKVQYDHLKEVHDGIYLGYNLHQEITTDTILEDDLNRPVFEFNEPCNPESGFYIYEYEKKTAEYQLHRYFLLAPEQTERKTARKFVQD